MLANVKNLGYDGKKTKAEVGMGWIVYEGFSRYSL